MTENRPMKARYARAKAAAEARGPESPGARANRLGATRKNAKPNYLRRKSAEEKEIARLEHFIAGLRWVARFQRYRSHSDHYTFAGRKWTEPTGPKRARLTEEGRRMLTYLANRRDALGLELTQAMTISGESRIRPVLAPSRMPSERSFDR